MSGGVKFTPDVEYQKLLKLVDVPSVIKNKKDTFVEAQSMGENRAIALPDDVQSFRYSIDSGWTDGRTELVKQYCTLHADTQLKIYQYKSREKYCGVCESTGTNQAARCCK